MADTSVIQAWQDPLLFVVGASPFVIYPVSLFRGSEYEPTDLLKARVVDSYSSLAHLFSLHEGISDAWGSSIARDLSTLPRNKKEMEVYIRSIQHKHENDWQEHFTETFSGFFEANDYYQLCDVQFENSIFDCHWTLQVYNAETGLPAHTENDPFIAAYSEAGVLAFWTDDEALVSETPRDYYACYKNALGDDELCVLLSFTVASFD